MTLTDNDVSKYKMFSDSGYLGYSAVPTTKPDAKPDAVRSYTFDFSDDIRGHMSVSDQSTKQFYAEVAYEGGPATHLGNRTIYRSSSGQCTIDGHSTHTQTVVYNSSLHFIICSVCGNYYGESEHYYEDSDGNELTDGYCAQNGCGYIKSENSGHAVPSLRMELDPELITPVVGEVAATVDYSSGYAWDSQSSWRGLAGTLNKSLASQYSWAPFEVAKNLSMNKGWNTFSFSDGRIYWQDENQRMMKKNSVFEPGKTYYLVIRLINNHTYLDHTWKEYAQWIDDYGFSYNYKVTYNQYDPSLRLDSKYMSQYTLNGQSPVYFHDERYRSKQAYLEYGGQKNAYCYVQHEYTLKYKFTTPGGDAPEHEHIQSDYLQYDRTEHWHTCAVEGCEMEAVRLDRANHTWDANGVCTECGAGVIQNMSIRNVNEAVKEKLNTLRPDEDAYLYEIPTVKNTAFFLPASLNSVVSLSKNSPIAWYTKESGTEAYQYYASTQWRAEGVKLKSGKCYLGIALDVKEGNLLDKSKLAAYTYDGKAPVDMLITDRNTYVLLYEYTVCDADGIVSQDLPTSAYYTYGDAIQKVPFKADAKCHPFDLASDAAHSKTTYTLYYWNNIGGEIRTEKLFTRADGSTDFTPKNNEGLYKYQIIATLHSGVKVSSQIYSVFYTQTLHAGNASDDVKIVAGNQVQLSAYFYGTGTTQQWYTCDSDGNNRIAIDGATDARYTFTSNEDEEKDYYFVCEAKDILSDYPADEAHQSDPVYSRVIKVSAIKDTTITPAWFNVTMYANGETVPSNTTNSPLQYEQNDAPVFRLDIDSYRKNIALYGDKTPVVGTITYDWTLYPVNSEGSIVFTPVKSGVGNEVKFGSNTLDEGIYYLWMSANNKVDGIDGRGSGNAAVYLQISDHVHDTNIVSRSTDSDHEQNHDLICEACANKGISYTVKQAHTFDESDPTYYKAPTYISEGKKICTVCGEEVVIAQIPHEHIGGTATCLNYPICGLCGEEYGAKMKHSAGSVYDTDDTTHYAKCKYGCGTTVATGNHVYDNDADMTCNVCGYDRSAPVYSVTIEAGVGTGTPITVETNSYIVPACTFTAPSGFEFDTWHCDVDDKDYAVGNVMTITRDTVLTAQWKSAGVTVSGTVTSYNDESGTVTLELIKSGETEATATTTVTGNTGSYTFNGVAAGTYTLRVSKANHVTREYTIKANGINSVIKNIELWQIGDVNEDGEIDIRDLVRLKKKALGAINAENASADLNGDSKVNALDATEMKKMLLGV